MEGELERITRFLAQNKWPFRMHATYDESITRALDVFERVNKDVPLKDPHWFIDHAETISPGNIDRVKALGGGIAIQHRMAYQGEDFAQRYGKQVTEDSPPIKRILEAGVPLGAGTDATRVASYNPWVSLYWLVTGKTLGGMPMYPKAKRIDRETALRLWTEANTWFSNEEGKKGAIKAGQLADLAVLSSDYMTVAEDGIKDITSVLTVLGGNVVHGAGPFGKLAPPLWQVLPGRRSACWEAITGKAAPNPPQGKNRLLRAAARCTATTRTPGSRKCPPPIKARSGARSAAVAGWPDRPGPFNGLRLCDRLRDSRIPAVTEYDQLGR